MNMIYEIKDFSLENKDLSLYETLFHNANGYIGVRSNFEEGYPASYDTIRGSYINGFYDIAEMKQAEKLCGLVEDKQTMLNVADPQGITLTLDGEPFNLFTGTILKSRRYVHMGDGVTGREVTWRSPAGREIRISSRRMASFTQLSLFTIEYQIESLNFNGTVQITSTHRGDVKNYCNPDVPRIAGENFDHLVPAQARLDGRDSYLLTSTSRSGLQVCTGVHHALHTSDGTAAADIHTCLNGHGAVCNAGLSMKPGQKITLIKYTVFTDSLRHADCYQAAHTEMKQALQHSLSDLYAAQKDYLDHFWSQSLLEIKGDDELALATRYNQYQLLQSVGKDACSNIAAKGLSGEGYEGHYFWDTEMYIQPFFTLTNPDISRNLISYRYQILDAARENARILGHQSGALYPWRTIMGKECSGYFPSGSAAYHINGDIAYSVVAYYLATKDFDFMAEKGAEILFETARLWLDTGNYYQGKFHIREVTGPDEYTCMTDNNYYTNVCAKYNLYWAVKFYDMLTATDRADDVISRIALRPEEIEAFRQAEAAMYLPYDKNLRINPQDDSFLSKKIWDIKHTPADKFPLLLHYHPLYLYRHQVCKQADTVLAHFVLEDMQDLETMRNSFAYYEQITTHDSSLSTCIYSIMASRLGLTDKAYDYFGDSAKLDLFNTHANTKDGIHTANMGGNYMSIVYGFAGLRLKENGLTFRPALPQQWDSYRFRIQYEGSLIEITIRKDSCTFSLLAGRPKDIIVYQTIHHLDDTIELPLETAAP